MNQSKNRISIISGNRFPESDTTGFHHARERHRNTTLSKRKAPPCINYHEVGQAYYHIITPMKYLGLCPLRITRAGEHYDPPNLLWKLATVIWVALILLIVATFALNKGFGIGWPRTM